MRHRTATTIAVAGVAAAGIVLTVGMGTASASSRVHTQTFQAQASTAPLMTSADTFVIAETDVADSKTIGRDVLDCKLTKSGSTCDVAFAQAHGLIYAHLRLRDGATTFTGTVTGGTRRYRDAHGTLTGTTLSQTAVQVTLRYSDCAGK